MNNTISGKDMININEFMPGKLFNDGSCNFLVRYNNGTFDIVSMITKGSYICCKVLQENSGVYFSSTKEKEVEITHWVLLNGRGDDD